MKIKMSYNNNIVLGIDDAGKEVVVIGKGVGFSKKTGDRIDQKRISKVYYPEDEKDDKRLVEILKSIPLDCIEVTNEILQYGERKLEKELNPTLLISLSDHIHCAIDRVEQGMKIGSPLIGEIQTIYPVEYGISRHAIDLIHENTGVLLPDSEIMYIAFHFVNAQLKGGDLRETVELTKITSESINRIESYADFEIDKGSITFTRFLAHLRYYIIRHLRNQINDDTEINDLAKIAKRKYPNAYSCAEALDAFLTSNYEMKSTESERFYMTLHIQRLLVE